MDNSFSPQDLLRPLARHWGKSLLVFIVVFGLALGVSLLMADKYVSEARLFVRIGRATVALDPTATVGQTLALSETREMELNSVSEVLGSRSLLEALVDEYGPEVILKQRLPSPDGVAREPSASDKLKESLGQIVGAVEDLIPHKTLSPREEAIQKLSKSVGVEVTKKSAIVRVYCKAKSPELAQKLLDSLITHFLAQHVRVNRSEGSFEFFDEQLAQNEKELEAASERLRDTKNSMGVVSIEGKRQILQEKIGHIDKELLNAEAKLQSAESGAAKLRQEVTSLPEQINSLETNGFPNVALDTMRNELYRLEIRERELLSKYQETHPLVVATRAQVKEARRIIEGLPADRVQVTTAINPTRQAIEKDLLSEQALISTVQGLIEGLKAQRTLALEELMSLNDKEIHLAELQRAVASKEVNHRIYTEKLEQARINRSMEESQLSNVNIAQPPTLNEKPDSPNRTLLMLVSLAGAVCAAVGLAFLLDLCDRSLRTAGEAQRQLELPVLASIPRLAPQRALVN